MTPRRYTVTRVADGWQLDGWKPIAVFRTFCAFLAWRARQVKGEAADADAEDEAEQLELWRKAA